MSSERPYCGSVLVFVRNIRTYRRELSIGRNVRRAPRLRPTQTRTTRTLVLAVALAASGCVRQLPPPEAPSQEIAADLRARAASTRAPEGRGVVVLDVTEGQATVTDLGTEFDGAGRREVCTTPCVTDLSLGEHRLVFRQGSRSDEVTLNVEQTPRVHRRAMSFDSGSHVE